GALLAGEWLVPSMAVAADRDAAYTWTRSARETLSSFFDGSLLSSCFAAFYPSRPSESASGALAIGPGALGAIEALRRRHSAVIGCIVTVVAALWLSIGPKGGFLVRGAPAYEHLLWYRFITLAIFATVLVAAYGAWRVVKRGHPWAMALLLAGAGWAALVTS